MIGRPANVWKRVSLLLLYSRDGMTTRQVATKLKKDPHSANSLMQKYAEKGLVRRVPDTKPIVWRHEFFA